MKILLIFIQLYFIKGCVSFIVTGYSGGTAIIYCHYYRGEEHYGKYFCMGQNSLSCEEKIRSGSQNTWEHSGRFSLYDKTVVNYFTVVIRQLTRQDEGTYWCGVGEPVVPDSYTKVELEVKEDKCCLKSVTETVYLGGEATMICNYPEKYENSSKYFCKENRDLNECDSIISESVRRFTVTDNRTEKSFTVTIRDLTEDDTGTYWCGVETRIDEVLRYITVFTEVHLSVTDSTPSPQSIPSAPSATFINTSGILVVIIVSLCCILVVIILSVILVVGFITIVLVIVYRRKVEAAPSEMSSEMVF
ncbi:CMRF35-like molecule 9 [Esox lucius]|uniref:CMRF35-like molecule 9 n=1 Tax=Esox lucius TaxID=8010 RepID=UPI001476E770|nr:CMRF35-like molecule 9 [Esox lucius]